jgi:mycothiol synthase
MNVRPFTPADAPAVAALAAADEEALRGRPSKIQPQDVVAWLSRADLEHDSWLFEDDGKLVAAGWFEAYGEIGTALGVVAQGAKGRGLGTAIADRGEASSRAHGVERVHTFLLPEDAAARSLFEARGFREVRRFYEMAIELTGPPPSPALEDGLVLEVFRQEDARAFHEAVADAFAENWEFHSLPFDEWWEMRKGQDADEHGPLWFVVRDGGEIAAAIRNEANRAGGGYVAMLGVRRPWRGRGLGRALLHRAFAEFWGRGLTRVTLGVDAENPHGATKLYESVGMEVESSMLTFEKSLA